MTEDNINLKSSTLNNTAAPQIYPVSDISAKRKISIRQLMILFFFATISNITRVTVPLLGDETAVSKATWLAPFIALLPILLLIFILYEVTKKHKEKSLAQIIEMVLGKMIGKIVLFAFFSYVLLYISFFMRNFSEKFISSIFSEITPAFFIIVLLLVSVFASQRNIESFARFAEIAFILTVFVFVFALFASIFHINPKNLYPVTSYDAIPILKASVPVISVLSLLTFTLFLGDDVSKYDNFKQVTTKYTLYLTLFKLLGTIVVTGIFNVQTVSNMSMPYFMMFKTIKTTGIIQSLETFFIIFWVFTDFIMIVYYFFIMSKISKKLFVLEKPNLFIVPLVFIILIMTYFIGENEFEFEYFYRTFINYGGIILGFIVPVTVLLVGKARKIL